MKTKHFFLMAAVVLLVSCGTQKQAVVQQQSKAPFGETFSMPCDVKDTKENFAGTGIYRGSSYQKGEVHLNAIENAKRVIREKVHHAYKGMISDYSGTWGNNRGNDIATKVERAGDAILDLMLNDAYEVCTQFSQVFDDGHIECYVALEISKEEFVQKTSHQVADILTEEEKEKINFSEYNFRKNMEERMQNYKDSKK